MARSGAPHEDEPLGAVPNEHNDEATPIDPPPYSDPTAGEVVGGYELLELLGKGGAGSVFSARRLDDGRIAALKVLAAQKLSRPRVVQRFRDEARTASTVRHPSLVEFIEFIEEPGGHRLAYAMEYVRGVSLRAKLQNEPVLPLGEAIHIAKQICLGVEALHDSRIIHRDLKPENVMLVAPELPGQPTKVKILDFGVAKFLGKEREAPVLSETPGTFVGTPRYMAPEQAAGGAVDARSDLFAIGVMLFEMITGQRPHEGDSLKAVVMAKLKGAPRLTMNPDREILPMELADIVDACLKLQPDLRPGDARTVIRILEDAQAVLAAVGSVRLDPSSGVVRAGSTTGATANPAPKTSRVREQVLPRRLDTPAHDESRTAPGAPPAVLATHTPALLAPPGLAAKNKPRTRMLLWLAVTASVLVVGGVLLILTADDAEVYVPPVSHSQEPEVRSIQVSSMPPGAWISVRGKPIGTAPQAVSVQEGEALDVEVSLAGFRPRTVQVTARSGASVLVPLEKITEEKPPTPPAPEAPPSAAQPAPPPAPRPPSAGAGPGHRVPVDAPAIPKNKAKTAPVEEDDDVEVDVGDDYEVDLGDSPPETPEPQKSPDPAGEIP